MKRAILAFLVGLVTWIVVVSLLDRGLRVAIEGYAAAEPKMVFTLGMELARLAMAAITSVIAGAVVGSIARSSSRVAWGLGALLFVAFIPLHIRVWNLFPLWYHLTFLGTLAPLIALGSRIARTQLSGGSGGSATDGHVLPAQGASPK
jgi:hypothetical protein